MMITGDRDIDIKIESWKRENPKRLTALYGLLQMNKASIEEKMDGKSLDSDIAKIKQLGDEFDKYHQSEIKKHYYEYRERFSSDPLSDITRKERRNLLGVCALSVFIIHSNASTKGFQFFGINFENSPVTAFDIGLFVICFYFFLAFFYYCKDDFYRLSIAEDYLYQLKKTLFIPLNERAVSYLEHIEHEWVRHLVKDAIRDFDLKEGFGYSILLRSPWMEPEPPKSYIGRLMYPYRNLPNRYIFDLYIPIFVGIYTLILLAKKILVDLYINGYLDVIKF